MASEEQSDGKNSLIGEFVVAFIRAPDPVKEAILIQGLKIMLPYNSSLIAPYPMLSHLLGILQKQGIITGGGSATGGSSGGTPPAGGTPSGGSGGSSRTH